jgi:plasmid maintenance system antidote protein VapI
MAKKLGISAPYFSLIYNGRVGVSSICAARWRKWFGKSDRWWNMATTAQKQRLFDRFIRRGK